MDPAPDQTDKKLQYCDVGTAGKVTLKAVQPGVGGPIYVNHFPSLSTCNSVYYIPSRITILRF